VYSNDGGKLAVGVSTGEVEVFDPTSNHNLFTLRDPVTCTEVRLHVWHQMCTNMLIYYCMSAGIPVTSNFTCLLWGW